MRMLVRRGLHGEDQNFNREDPPEAVSAADSHALQASSCFKMAQASLKKYIESAARTIQPLRVRHLGGGDIL